LKEPSEYLPAFEKALKKQAERLHDPRTGDVKDMEFYIGVEGALPQAEVNPRTLLANYLGRMVLIEGIVTRCKISLDLFDFITVFCTLNSGSIFHFIVARCAGSAKDSQECSL
jgi:DNA replicative helicase MCM subunit Mcm2 (Cdc46/Mcm family)